MRVFKNLFGKGDKIDVDEIANLAGTLLSDLIITDIDTSEKYVVFGNKLMICWGSLAPTVVPNITRGSIFISDNFSVSFPKAFKSTPIVTIESVLNNRWASITSTPTASSFNANLMSANSSTDTANVFWLAIGLVG